MPILRKTAPGQRFRTSGDSSVDTRYDMLYYIRNNEEDGKMKIIILEKLRKMLEKFKDIIKKR